MYETGTSYGALLGKCRVFFEFMENKNTLRISNLLYKFALRVTNMNILVEQIKQKKWNDYIYAC